MEVISDELMTVISIHAPREGGDRLQILGYRPCHKFQSTPPARGATWNTITISSVEDIFQSTPPARGATLSRNL